MKQGINVESVTQRDGGGKEKRKEKQSGQMGR